MFAMVSSSLDRVAPRADRCLGGQFACAQVHYPMFWTIVDVRNGCLGGGCSVCFGVEKGFHVGFNLNYRRVGTSIHNRAQPWYFRHTDIMDIDVVVFTPSASLWHIQGHALHPYIMGDATVPWFGPIPPIGRQGIQKQL